MTKQRQTKTGPVCPKCGRAHVIPILYGLPSYEAFQRSQQGEFVLGGCVVFGDDPRWECPECHERFGDLEA